MAYETSFEVTPHPPTIFVSSGLSMISALLIIYLYLMHKHLRTLFFNTFAVLVSLGAFQFIVLVTPLTCFWEGFFMYYILTFNNCITAFIIWLLYAFVRYGKRIEQTVDIENHITINSIDSQVSAPTELQLTTTDNNETSPISKQMGLGNHLSRQLSFKNKLGDIEFELSMLQKVFWYSFIAVVPLAITFVGYFDDFYGPWTPWCFIMFLDERVLYYHGQVYILWTYYAIMFVLVCNENRKIKGKSVQTWQTMAMTSFLGQLFVRLIFMTVSLTRCSSDWATHMDESHGLKTMECSLWCYFVGFCTPLSLSFMPVFQWVWIHRDMVPYLLCKKDLNCAVCDKLFWKDHKYDDNTNDDIKDVNSDNESIAKV
eukprot:243832_1